MDGMEIKRGHWNFDKHRFLSISKYFYTIDKTNKQQQKLCGNPGLHYTIIASCYTYYSFC